MVDYTRYNYIHPFTMFTLQEYLSQLGGAFSDDPGRFYADVPLDKNPEAIFGKKSKVVFSILNYHNVLS